MNGNHIPRKSDSPLRGGGPEEFFFICVDPKTLNGHRLSQYLTKFFQLLGGPEARNRFDTFVAHVEDVGLSPQQKETNTEYFGITGQALWFPTVNIREILERKYFDEREHARDQGHESTHAPAVLTPRTAAVSIGSRSHLGQIAELTFERSGILRKHTIGSLQGLLALKENGSLKKGEFDYLPVPVKGEAAEKLYPGNFDELVRRAVHMQQMIHRESLPGLLAEGERRLARSRAR